MWGRMASCAPVGYRRLGGEVEPPRTATIRGSGTIVIEPVTEPEVHEPSTGDPHIRCPHCHWSPRPHDHWSCLCGHRWNTLDTGGVCPSCLKRWTSTQCPQ